jgi:4-hydroxybutyryl-CoA dehydratase / vinylacetyl-CoA-Delta-isomerase
MKTPDEYIESLRGRKLEIYYMGERIKEPIDHPAFRPHINAAAHTYASSPHDGEASTLITVRSHLTGEPINRFTHIHQSIDDLINKAKLLRSLSQHVGSCYQRCVGWDALNALYVVTYDMDAKLGTSYHKRLVSYLRHVQENDLMCTGAMTDNKGDRSLSPGQQSDPDQYMHIIDRQEAGIIVRGAKVHQTGAVNSHEIIVMPTAGLEPTEIDYALAFAIPTDTPGLVYIFGRQTNDSRKVEGCLDQGNQQYGMVGGESLVVFEDVFVPWERVFMCGETEFAGQLVEMFASYHRQNYGGCKAGVADVLIGATALLADYQGVSKASHVRDKITEMVQLAESLYCCSIACSAQGTRTASGAYFVDPLLANVTKLNVTRSVYEISRLAQDISGGIIATLPSEHDLHHPRVGPLMNKYLAAREGVSTESRFRVARLVENMTGGTALVESMHGAGSPQAQKIMILRRANLSYKIRLAARLAGVSVEDKKGT